MKKLVRQILNSRLGLKLRDITNFYPPLFSYQYQEQFLSSDLFIWRTDKNLETIFKASDILNKFYNIKSKLFFNFFSSDGEFILSKELEFENGISELIINENFLGVAGYGTFCVFNIPIEKHSELLKVTNRCYIGYGRNKAFSMVHGNLNALMVKDPYVSLDDLINHIKPAITSRKSNFEYHIQKKPSTNTTVSYYFANPLDRIINININNKFLSIKPLGCGFITFEKIFSSKPHIIKSDFCFARPILINETKGFLDCHHG